MAMNILLLSVFHFCHLSPPCNNGEISMSYFVYPLRKFWHVQPPIPELPLIQDPTGLTPPSSLSHPFHTITKPACMYTDALRELFSKKREMVKVILFCNISIAWNFFFLKAYCFKKLNSWRTLCREIFECTE